MFAEKLLRPVVISLCLFCMQAAASAQDTAGGPEHSACTEAIKKCFLRAEEQKGSCFWAAGKDPICKNDPLGRLALKRAAFAAERPTDSNAGRLGPQLVDKQCVAKFDALWSGLLLESAAAAAQVDTLQATLDRCVIKPPTGIERP